MPIAGSPKKLAQDIADGFLSLSPPQLRQYTPVELKTIQTHLALVARDLRGQQVPLDDLPAIKAKQMRLSRLRQAEIVILAHCKKKRIPL